MESFQLLRFGKNSVYSNVCESVEAGVPDIWSTYVQKADLDTPSRKQPTKGVKQSSACNNRVCPCEVLQDVQITAREGGHLGSSL
jgi:hypothetical protein